MLLLAIRIEFGIYNDEIFDSSFDGRLPSILNVSITYMYTVYSYIKLSY